MALTSNENTGITGMVYTMTVETGVYVRSTSKSAAVANSDEVFAPDDGVCEAAGHHFPGIVEWTIDGVLAGSTGLAAATPAASVTLATDVSVAGVDCGSGTAVCLGVSQAQTLGSYETLSCNGKHYNGII